MWSHPEQAASMRQALGLKSVCLHFYLHLLLGMGRAPQEKLINSSLLSNRSHHADKFSIWKLYAHCTAPEW